MSRLSPFAIGRTGFSGRSPDERRHLETLQSLGGEAYEALLRAGHREHTVEAGGEIFCGGETADHFSLLNRGWAFKYKLLSDGRRQTFTFCLPGDLLGLQHCLLQRPDHTIEAITDCELRTFPVSALETVAETNSRLAMVLMWYGAQELSLLQEHLTNTGRRTALESVGHLLLELHARLEARGMADEAYELPLTQEHIADALGLSVVHVNRTLRKLKERELIRTGDHRITLLDQEALAELCEFSTDYLEVAGEE